MYVLVWTYVCGSIWQGRHTRFCPLKGALRGRCQCSLRRESHLQPGVDIILVYPAVQLLLDLVHFQAVTRHQAAAVMQARQVVAAN